MADEIIKKLSAIEIGDGNDDGSSSPKTKSLIGNGDDSEPSPPKKVTTIFHWPSSIDAKEDKSETESTEMPSVKHADDAQVSVKEVKSESKKMTSVEHGDTASEVSVFNLIDPTELETDSPKSSSSSGSGSGSESGSGSASGSVSGSEAGSVSASSTDSVESTCSAFCLVLQMEALTNIRRGRAAAAASNDVEESDPVTVLVSSPVSFLMRAFNNGWNASVEGLSTLPATVEDDFATACTVLPVAAHLTGMWFETFDNRPRHLPLPVFIKLYLAWRRARSSIGRYVLAKYGYEKHSEMVDFGDFFTLGRF